MTECERCSDDVPRRTAVFDEDYAKSLYCGDCYKTVKEEYKARIEAGSEYV